MKKLIKSTLSGLILPHVSEIKYRLDKNEAAIDANRMLLGQLHSARVNSLSKVDSLQDVEFSVYSQWGEDGILEFLIANIEIENAHFVEFGVENYTESNTRFLLRNRHWKGLVIDGDQRNIDYIHSDRIYWQHNLKAICAFVTAENINDLILQNGFEGDIGLLSIDIDGNDFWVWKAIDVIKPRIVVSEFNSVFGSKHAFTIPYDPSFVRTNAHYSNLYWGASLQALCKLGTEKGYTFVGCNKSGVNAFFVRNDCLRNFSSLTAHAQYVSSTVRDSRDQHGNLTFLEGDARLKEIKDCTVYNIDSDSLSTISKIVGL